MDKTNFQPDVVLKAVKKYAEENNIDTLNYNEVLSLTVDLKDKVSKLSPQEINLLKQAMGKDELYRLEQILDEVK